MDLNPIGHKENPGGHIEETSMISGAEIAELLVERVVPKLWDYGKMLWSGRQFLILGPARSGEARMARAKQSSPIIRTV